MKYRFVMLLWVLLWAGCATVPEDHIEMRLKAEDRAVVPEVMRVKRIPEYDFFTGCSLDRCTQFRMGEFVTETGDSLEYFFKEGSPHFSLPNVEEYLIMIVAHPPERYPYQERHLLVVPVDAAGEVVDE